MKNRRQRELEDNLGTAMLVMFLLLVIGSSGNLVAPLSNLDSVLFERGIQISVILSVLLGVYQVRKSSF